MNRTALNKRAGFTLLEMMVATGLFVILITAMFTFYDRTIEETRKGTEESRKIQLARVVLDRMAREIRQSVAAIPLYGPGVYGIKDNIEINTLTVPDRKLSEERSIRDAKLPAQFDLEQIRYYIAWDHENVGTDGLPVALGLVRKVSKTYMRDVVIADDAMVEDETGEDAALAIKEELYAPEIRFLEFKYFDGAKWWDKWELAQANSVPQMVQVTIGFIPEEYEEEDDLDLVEDDFLQDEEELDPLPEDRYSILVRLKQADVFFGSRVSREVSAFGESGGM